MTDRINQVTKTLEVFLAGGESLPQAYLFIGTTTANSIGKDFASKLLDNKFPNVDSVQFDASEQFTSINTLREVLRMAALKPVQSKHKVVLMTNMDVATPQMMSALLKTLEEPPSHVVFILVSKNPLLSTVMSRCQVFSLPDVIGNIEDSDELATVMDLLKSNQSAGIAERMALVTKLSDIDDSVLCLGIEMWMKSQISQLNKFPEHFSAVRSSVETLHALQKNFNKKIVLQKFVLNGLL